MKKFMMLSAFLAWTVFLITGCSRSADEKGLKVQTLEVVQEEAAVVTAVSSTVEGYHQVEGSLEELDTKTVSMQTADGHALCFKLAPETLVYKGERKDLVPGDEITVVFEGDLKGTDTKGVSVITVSAVQ